MSEVLIFLLIFASIALIISAVLMFVRDIFFPPKEPPKLRLDNIQLEMPEIPGEKKTQAETDKSRSREPAPPQPGWFDRMVFESGIGMSPLEYLLLMLLFGVLVGGVGFIIRNQFILGLIGFSVGMMIVLIVLALIRNRRYFAILRQLHGMTNFLSRSVRAGESIDQSLSTVSDTLAPPLKKEFKNCAKQLAMGLSLEKSLRNVVAKLPTVEIRLLATTLIVQHQSGGNLASMLDRLTMIFRDRLISKQRSRAATATSRVSALVITVVALCAVTYALVVQPEYLQTTLESLIGRVLLTIAGVLLVIGIAFVLILLRTD